MKIQIQIPQEMTDKLVSQVREKIDERIRELVESIDIKEEIGHSIDRVTRRYTFKAQRLMKKLMNE